MTEIQIEESDQVDAEHIETVNADTAHVMAEEVTHSPTPENERPEWHLDERLWKGVIIGILFTLTWAYIFLV